MKALFYTFLGLSLLFLSCNDNLSDISPEVTDSMLELDVLPAEELSELEGNALIFMREEEKLARDVYDQLYAKWGVKIFDKISSSEQSHMDAVLRLLDKYELEDPVASDIPGSFVNEDLSNLYSTLTQLGENSLTEALQVGAAIEEIDILDLQRELEQTVDNRDIQLVFENLMKGSKNHLRSFVKNLDNLGVAYVPQFLSEEDYQAIMQGSNN
tara:strand:- start:20665 stop:21303 length:639 start_codon:yes stop_codon:yes gene_type:complete